MNGAARRARTMGSRRIEWTRTVRRRWRVGISRSRLTKMSATTNDLRALPSSRRRRRVDDAVLAPSSRRPRAVAARTTIDDGDRRQHRSQTSLYTGAIVNTPGQEVLLHCWSALVFLAILFVLLLVAGLAFSKDYGTAARVLFVARPRIFAATFGGGASAADGAAHARELLTAFGVLAVFAVFFCLVAMYCIVVLVTPFEVAMHWLEWATLQATLLGCAVMALGIYGLQYNRSLCHAQRAPDGVYIAVIAVGVFSAVYAFFGYAAVLLERKGWLRLHCALGVALIVTWLVLFVLLLISRADAVASIEGGNCYRLLRYLPTGFWGAALDCNKCERCLSYRVCLVSCRSARRGRRRKRVRIMASQRAAPDTNATTRIIVRTETAVIWR